MKTVKLTKKMLKLHPADLLVKLGAVNKEKTESYPSNVYFSDKDSSALKKNLVTKAKKSMPSASKKYVDYSVGMEWLNYGPNESLGNVLKPGYAVIDTNFSEK